MVDVVDAPPPITRVIDATPIEATPIEATPIDVTPQPPLEFPIAKAHTHHRRRVRRSSRKPLKVVLAAAAVLTLAVVPAVVEHERHAAETSTPAVTSAPATPAPVPTPEPSPRRPMVSNSTAAAERDLTNPASPPAVPDGTLPAADSNNAAPRVTAQPAAFGPSFSNTGTAVFFQDEAGAGSALISGDRSQPGAILKITRIVDDNAQNFHARPSPDGSRIAFDSDREGTRAVFVADADGEHVRRLSGDGFAALPSWSPNGRQLAFVKAEADKPRVWNLWTADVSSGDLRRITSNENGQPWGGSWFPDGRRLAFGHESQLVLIDVETGARQTFPAPVANRLVRSPAVSPDGRKIIFQVPRDGTWMFDVRTKAMRRILDDPTAEEYSWSPDSRRVAFHSRRTGGWGVWVMGQ
jgi:WD40 repeat protein